MNWALKRQIIYLTSVIIFLSLVAFYFAYPYITKPPTCNDNKQNGNETGVDCGGSCALACVSEVDKLAIMWSRSFRVVPGRYNAVAYVENQNKNKAINSIKYRFRFGDKDNLYIGSREGETSVPPNGKFAIFEQAINLGNSTPVYTSFEFTETPIWVNIDENMIEQLKVNVSSIKFDDNNYIPRLSAKIKNDSFFLIPDFNAVAILYDEFNNAINVSNTYFPLLKGEEEVSINYTWREPIDKNVISTEIIPMYNIFNVRLK